MSINKEEDNYLNLLKDILENGSEKDDRTGVGTKAVFGRSLRFDLSKGFPLLTTKKVHIKSILHELFWFLSGNTNTKYLTDNGVKIWNEWADEKNELGPVYGKQWRCWESLTFVEPMIFEKKGPKIQTPFNKDFTVDYSSNESGLVGQKIKSQSCGEFIVLKEYKVPRTQNSQWSSKKFKVKFLDTGFEVDGVIGSSLKQGLIKDYYYPSVCGVACIGEPACRNDPDYELLKDTWYGMIRRCYDQKHEGFCNYGAKGVFVDDRWLIFSNFIADVKKIENWNLKKTFNKDYTLDKDFFGSNKYSLETCIWVSKEEQSVNQTDIQAFIAIAPNGKRFQSMGIKHFAKNYELSSDCIKLCLDGVQAEHKGWRFEKIDSELLPRIRIIDQIKWLIAEIKENPSSRRLLVSAWNCNELNSMALNPCHFAFQFGVVNNKLSCIFMMRSTDSFLGLPFNIASYAFLTHMLANICNLEVGELVYVGTDVHIYKNHFEQVKEQINREPREFPKLVIKRKPESIFDFKIEDFEIVGYDPHSAIKAPIAI